MDKIKKITIDTKSQGFSNASTDIGEIVWEQITDKRKLTQKQHMAIWHRPKEEHLNALKVHKNITAIITLQTQSEDIEFIQKFCDKQSVQWFNIPLHHKGNQDVFDKQGTDEIIIKSIKEIVDFLGSDKEQNILIHCSAGIHRSGIISYTLLRALTYEKENALQKIKQIRKITFNGLKEHKISHIEEKIIPFLV